ncbi:MAG: aquaporin [Bacteroidia bacterium]|jgi:aquaporin Z|nr:aquaporin [Bacteroidia bacterium]
MATHTLRQQLFAEALGTFFLVFCGTGAIIINDISAGAITHGGVALTFGLVVMVLIYALGEISGAHFNPAVSIGFALAGRFQWSRVPGYVIMQFVGAVSASFLLKWLFPSHELLGATLPSGSAGQSLVLEFLLTFFLMLVILQVSQGAREKGITAALAVGGLVALEAMFAGPVCGASMNPFRSLAPALASGYFEHSWIYLLGPVAGAGFAVAASRLLHSSSVNKQS